MKTLSVILTASMAAFLLQGCTNNMSGSDKEARSVISGPSTSRLPIGKTYSKTPPKLVRQEVSWGKNKPVQSIAWDNSQWFGPVPANMMKEGMATCQAVGGQKARGYHPKAMGINGKPIPGGGFLCG